MEQINFEPLLQTRQVSGHEPSLSAGFISIVQSVKIPVPGIHLECPAIYLVNADARYGSVGPRSPSRGPSTVCPRIERGDRGAVGADELVQLPQHRVEGDRPAVRHQAAVRESLRPSLTGASLSRRSVSAASSAAQVRPPSPSPRRLTTSHAHHLAAIP